MGKILLLLFLSINLYSKECYKLIYQDSDFHPDYEFLELAKGDSSYYVLIETRKLNGIHTYELFETDSCYELELDYKRSSFTNFPYLVTDNKDSLKKFSSLEIGVEFAASLTNVSPNQHIVYELNNFDDLIKNVKHLNDRLVYDERIYSEFFDINKLLAKTRLFRNNISVKIDELARISNFSIYKDFIYVERQDYTILESIILDNKLVELRELLEIDTLEYFQKKAPRIIYRELYYTDVNISIPNTFLFHVFYKDFIIIAEVTFKDYEWNKSISLYKFHRENIKGFQIYKHGA